jgi:hypothetical protein
MTNTGFWLLILRNGQVFVPTMAKMEADIYMGIEPVEAIDARDLAGP